MHALAKYKMPLWGRWTGLGLGLLTLLWTGIEDLDIWYFVGLSILWSSWGAVILRKGQRFKHTWKAALWGVAAGLAVTPFALFLVALKGGLHGHGFSDLTVSQLQKLVGLSLWWVSAGGILGGLIPGLVK